MNSELARIFDEMAAVLELTGANAFRVNAHRRVARVLKDLTVDVSTLADEPARLVEIDGIGAGSAKKIVEFVRTGRVREHDELLETIPRGLLDLLRVPGLGPKSVKMLWERAGVTDLASLRAACDSGAVAALPRMGAKTVENIAAALDFAARAGERMPLGVALPIAESIVQRLAAVPGAGAVCCAGSLRRGRETIGDIDIIAAGGDPLAIAEAFRTMDGVGQVLAAGPTKVSLRLADGPQVDLRLVEADAFGAALLYFTGSREHNVLLRERAAKRARRLNEYGLFPDDGEAAPPQTRGVAPVAAATEADIYAALDLPYVPPELREARGELDAPVPELIEVQDIRAELHAHTTASDGTLSIEQLARAAKGRGFHTIAVTDHSRSSAQANGLSVERLRVHVAAVRAADAAITGISILAGAEVDIHADGSLDYDDDVLAELDIVVASPHAALRQERAKATRRLLAAIEHPLVHVLGHPSGRLIGRRAGLEIDIDTLAAAAAEHDVALEINANWQRLDLRDVHVRAALDKGTLIAINTDFHREGNFEQLRYGVLTARRGGLTADRCINTWTNARLATWLKRKR